MARRLAVLLFAFSLISCGRSQCICDTTPCPTEENNCSAEGIFPDPDHCEKFIQCTFKGPVSDPDDAYEEYINDCGLTATGVQLLWNACQNACEEPGVYEVCCGPRPLPDGSVQDAGANICDCDACGSGQTTDKPTTTARTTTTEEDDDTTTLPGVTTTEEDDDTTTLPGQTTTEGDDGTTTLPGQTTTEEDDDTTTLPGATTTTTARQTTTTRTTQPPCTDCEHPRWPSKIMGFYITLADDTEEGFESNSEFEPALYDYQQQAANVLFFCFVNPITMQIPNAFLKLASSRGTGNPGAVPQDTVIIFAIGGYSYSLGEYNPWPWLESQSAAEAMAEQVVEWKFTYNCDGIDLDIETGAGDVAGAGDNLVHFIRRIRELDPDFIVSQPTFGYPQVEAEIDVINASWNQGASSNDLADSVGIMVYEGTQSLNYVENYAHGSQQWEGFPITVDVPYGSILVGCKGSANANDINTLATEVNNQGLLGIMVWYNSVVAGLQYDLSWDTSEDSASDSQSAFIQARSTMGIPAATISK